MREIKFRAWDNDGKEMYPQKNISIELDIGYDLSLSKDGFILEQYTGLKDKNGKEIYEGDIIKDEINEVSEVIFYNGMYFFKNIKYSWDEFLKKDVHTWEECMTFLNKSRVEDIEIIGNIHENGDLL